MYDKSGYDGRTKLVYQAAKDYMNDDSRIVSEFKAPHILGTTLDEDLNPTLVGKILTSIADDPHSDLVIVSTETKNSYAFVEDDDE